MTASRVDASRTVPSLLARSVMTGPDAVNRSAGASAPSPSIVYTRPSASPTATVEESALAATAVMSASKVTKRSTSGEANAARSRASLVAADSSVRKPCTARSCASRRSESSSPEPVLAS